MPPQNVHMLSRDTLPSSSSLVDEDGSPRYPGTSTHGGASSFSSPSTTATATGTMPRTTSISHLSQEATKVKIIRDAIRAEDKRLRSQYFLLREEWQDTVGAAIFLTAACTWALLSYAWYIGALSTPFLIIGNALAISLLHEMEHDLIHDLYFKKNKAVQNAMFAFIWVIKSNANPWWRRYYHLRHHQYAGQVVDVEERLIGLGLPWNSFKRLLVTFTPAATLLIADDIVKDDPDFSKQVLVRYNSPVIAFSTVAMVIHLCHCLGVGELLVAAGILPVGFHEALLRYLLPFLVLYNSTVNLPNVLRQSSLVIISTYCHYYGDIPERDVFFQTQILNHPLLWPFQMFCFNFGATHIIHHFVTRQPFYLRQLTAFRVTPVMLEQGCRHNDLGNHFRANRWGRKGEEPSVMMPVGEEKKVL
ncbi:hypothetical protein VYU27_006758 [Nannochloropsis oceanica]